MGCATCGTGVAGKPAGCRSNGSCATGGCNKLNTYDWLAKYDIEEYDPFRFAEVSFKHGASKDFYSIPETLDIHTGDMVVVEADGGVDVGRVSLCGELVRLQMRKKKIREDRIFQKIKNLATERDLEKLEEARSREAHTLLRSRAIARTLGLEMKIGDIQYQGDGRKATFFFTAKGRVDFRELIRHYAREFRVKIEMRQIGARQESARIGGIGSCGLELCCSTWLTDFKTVSTQAARYQNLSINLAKLSGQCGRLKCCLNYELDTYVEALQEFPSKTKLQDRNGTAHFVKADIFKKLMYYSIDTDHNRSRVVALPVENVKEIIAMNKKGEKPDILATMPDANSDSTDYGDVTGVVELAIPKRKKKGRRKRGRRSRKKQ